MSENKVIASYYGSKELPVEWKEGEKELLWFYDDLHCPHPISPLYFTTCGWWGPSCKYFYKKFGVGGSDWIGKKIGGYLYTAVVPPTTDADKVDGMNAYYGGVMPYYSDNFMKWWREEYIPELTEMSDKMVNFDFKGEGIPGAMVHLENCLDMFERAFEIHWTLNYAQAQASTEFQQIYERAVGPVDEDFSLITVSNDDRNWDSLRDAWKIKEEICADDAMKQYWLDNAVQTIRQGLADVPGGKEIVEKIDAYTSEYGWKAIYTHELIYETWIENNTPIYSAIKDYVEDDYDYPSQIKANNDSQQQAIERARTKIKDVSLRDEFEKRLASNLEFLPLTPDHHFYIDQKIQASMRIMYLGIGDLFVEAGKLDDREDIFMLTYDELRAGAFSDYDYRTLVKKARAEMEEAENIIPRYWYGTADDWSLNQEIYKRILWGYPDVFWKSLETEVTHGPAESTVNLELTLENILKFAKAPVEASGDKQKVLKAIPGSSGVVEGFARVVRSPAEFDQLKKGDIMVCKMTNPGWIISFSKIAGLVTDTGGALSHPAVVSREFGIPAVVGATVATRRINTGDRIRVDGDTGTVTILD